MEIVPAPWTKQSVVSKAKELMEEIGQSPVVLSREIEGFALNRIQYAYSILFLLMLLELAEMNII